MTAGESADAVSTIAIVTGGSRGLGRNTVLHLAKRGVDSLFTYRANRAEAEKLVGLVAEEGQRAIALPLDTGKVTTFDSFVEQVRASLAQRGAELNDADGLAALDRHHSASTRRAPSGARSEG